MRVVFRSCKSKKYPLANICEYQYFSSSISIKKLMLLENFLPKTFRITRKYAAFRSVTGQRFYVEPMLNLAMHGPARVCSMGILHGWAQRLIFVRFSALVWRNVSRGLWPDTCNLWRSTSKLCTACTAFINRKQNRFKL